jgi:hypothetical protein
MMETFFKQLRSLRYGSFNSGGEHLFTSEEGRNLNRSLYKWSQARRQPSSHPLHLCHSRSIQLNRQEMGIRNPRLLMVSGYSSWKTACAATWNQARQQGNKVFVQVLLCGRYSLHPSQPRITGHRFQAYRVSLSAFWADYIRKRRPFIFQGLGRNHRLLIQRTLKLTTIALRPSASSSSP